MLLELFKICKTSNPRVLSFLSSPKITLHVVSKRG
eukprot:UN12249